MSGVDDAVVKLVGDGPVAVATSATIEDFRELHASINAETDPLIQADRIGKEMVPLIARAPENLRAPMLDMLMTTCGKTQKRPALQRMIDQLVRDANPSTRGLLRLLDPDLAAGVPYVVRDHRTMRLDQREGYKPVANFEARIVHEVLYDTGTEKPRFLVFRGVLEGGRELQEVRIPAEKWEGMRWLAAAWGSAPAIEPDNGADRHMRRAIQYLSGGQLPVVTVHGFTGWIEGTGGWTYLHGGGGINARGHDETVRVELQDTLKLYSLPKPPTGADLVHAVRTSLACLGIGPLSVTAPMFAAVWRSVLPVIVDYALLLVAKTTSGKSEAMGLFQQHFGREFERKRLPTSWRSSPLRIENDMFAVQHALYSIDDVVTATTKQGNEKQKVDFDNVIRSIGNHSGRGRLTSNAEAKATKYPRCLAVMSAEDIPDARQSAVARCIVVEFGKDSMDLKLLRRMRDGVGKDGVLAAAMAGFLQWLAPRIDSVKKNFNAVREDLIEWAQGLGTSLRRTPMTIADLSVGLKTFLAFATEVGAITVSESTNLWTECLAAIGEVAADQGRGQIARDPVVQFLTLLKAAFVTEKANLGAMQADAPNASIAASWGWRLVSTGSGQYRAEDWKSCGDRIGWIDDAGKTIYLEPNMAYRVISDLATKSGDGLALRLRGLEKALFEAGKLAETEYETRNVYTVRVSVAGSRVPVLVLNVSTLTDPEIPDATCPTCPSKNESCPEKNTTINQIIQMVGLGNGNLGNLGNDSEHGSHARTDPVPSPDETLPLARAHEGSSQIHRPISPSCPNRNELGVDTTDSSGATPEKIDHGQSGLEEIR